MVFKNKQSLESLKGEIKTLKIEKERELILSKSYNEKQKLKNEINQLKNIQKNPSNFGNSFLKGIKILGKGIKMGVEGARELDKTSRVNNSPRVKRKSVRRRVPRNNVRMSPMPMYIPQDNKIYQSYTKPRVKRKSVRRKAKKKKMGIINREMMPWELN